MELFPVMHFVHYSRQVTQASDKLRVPDYSTINKKLNEIYNNFHDILLKSGADPMVGYWGGCKCKCATK